MMILNDAISALGIKNFSVNPDVITEESFNKSYREFNVKGEVSMEIGEPTITWSQVKAKYDELISLEPMRLLREERDRLLAELDWTQGKDEPDAISSKYTAYRQALRDLPSTASPTLVNGMLSNVTWPTKPE